MIRGCQRRIFYVKNPESDIFDEAYFVLRRGYTGRGVCSASDGELEKEAARITEQTAGGAGRKSGRKDKIVSFVAGAAAAGAAMGTAAFLIMR